LIILFRQEYRPEVSNGIFFYGEKGTVFVTERKWIIIPKGKDKQQTVNEVSADMAAKLLQRKYREPWKHP